MHQIQGINKSTPEKQADTRNQVEQRGPGFALASIGSRDIVTPNKQQPDDKHIQELCRHTGRREEGAYNFWHHVSSRLPGKELMIGEHKQDKQPR